MVRMKYQWFFDLSTAVGEMQVITVSCGGYDMVRRLSPFFSAYKYYRLGRVSIKMIPASTLPVDPSGLSYEAGENTVDPRDQLTPGLTRITNGEDIFEDFTGLTADQQRNLYYTLMLDPRWLKWSLQSGLKRSAYPLYWQVGQYHQDKYPGATMNYPGFGSATLGQNPDIFNQQFYGLTANTSGNGTQAKFHYERGISDPKGFFQVGHKGKLGWLPTDGMQEHNESNPHVQEYYVNTPACVELFKICLPPALKTKYYYRCYVTEECFFKEPILNLQPDIGMTSIDRFVRPGVIFARSPSAVLPPSVQGSPNYPPNSGEDSTGWND